MSRLGQIARGLGRFVPADFVRPLGRPAAVFFHGVERETLDARVQENHHELDAFRAIAETLKAEFDVLPLSMIDDALKAPERHKRTVFLMSDDGYANTCEIAADVLAGLSLPWTLFVSTHHIETGARNPIFLILLFVHYAPAGTYRVPHLTQPVVLASDREALAEPLVWKVRGLDMTRAQEAVDAMVSAFDPAILSSLLAKFSSERFLNWDQVRALAARGVEIGAHAHRHWPMHENQTGDMLREQAARPRELIAREVGPCRYFSYPFGNKGDVSREAWQAVRNAGYDCAFSTLSGCLDRTQNRFLLPRFAIGKRERNLAALIPMLRSGNPRLLRWQRELAG
ncbi:MAG TPA: polysaccharide deacetylase family protein [Rhizomicrobium sp.]|nr:polysaccharide deacetylase family protein [Rhizomicrobium sp.]